MKEQNQHRSESLFSLVASAIKRNAELPENLNLIANTLKTLAEELYKLKQHAATAATLINQHSEVLKNIVEVQDYILNNMHSHRSTETESVKVSKNKLDKLN